MRVLLAGASGAIGQHLVPLLTEANHEVIGITRTAGSLAGTGAREVVADVLDRPALLAALEGIKADAVIHQLTSLARAPRSYKDMRVTNRLRAEGTSTLIAAARMVRAKKFVAASFFGGYGFTDLGPVPLAETAPFGVPDDRNDAVLLALLSLEQQVRAFGGVSLRYGLFYDSTANGVSPVSRTWNGLVPMVHVKDAARAAVLALGKYRAGTVYNIADAHPMTYRAREIARAEASKIKPPRQLSDSLIRLMAPFGSMLLTRVNVSLDSSRARVELGWTPEFPSLIECFGGEAPRAEVIVAKAARESGPAAEHEPQLAAESETESETEPEPIAEPEPAAEPAPAAEPVEEPKPRASRHQPVRKPRVDVSRASAPTPQPDQEPDLSGDPFGDMDAAIARIGSRHL